MWANSGLACGPNTPTEIMALGLDRVRPLSHCLNLAECVSVPGETASGPRLLLPSGRFGIIARRLRQPIRGMPTVGIFARKKKYVCPVSMYAFRRHPLWRSGKKLLMLRQHFTIGAPSYKPSPYPKGSDAAWRRGSLIVSQNEKPTDTSARKYICYGGEHKNCSCLVDLPLPWRLKRRTINRAF